MLNKINLNVKSFITYVFILIEVVLYALLLAGDILTCYDTVLIKYTSIILCLIYSVVFIFYSKLDAILTSLALVFTLISDYFLLVLNNHFILGLTTFIIAQSFYFIRICFINKKVNLISILVRVFLPIIVCIILKLNDLLDLLTGLCAFYFIMLLVNATESSFLIKLDRRYILFFIGLILFIGCDVCVGLFNFSSVLNINIPNGLMDFVTISMWGFYLPSQTLIALSVKC